MKERQGVVRRSALTRIGSALGSSVLGLTMATSTPGCAEIFEFDVNPEPSGLHDHPMKPSSSSAPSSSPSSAPSVSDGATTKGQTAGTPGPTLALREPVGAELHINGALRLVVAEATPPKPDRHPAGAMRFSGVVIEAQGSDGAKERYLLDRGTSAVWKAFDGLLVEALVTPSPVVTRTILQGRPVSLIALRALSPPPSATYVGIEEPRLIRGTLTSSGDTKTLSDGTRTYAVAFDDFGKLGAPHRVVVHPLVRNPSLPDQATTIWIAGAALDSGY